jgi:hypothetical protein
MINEKVEGYSIPVINHMTKMEEDVKNIKRKVKEDWLNAIPELLAFAQNKFYKVVGCLIVGVEAVNIPNIEGYKPHFVVYPLWKDDLKKCLDAPYLYICLENKKGLQFSIPYLKNKDYFNEAAECFEKQIPISLTGNTTLKSLFELANSRFNDVLIKSNSAQQAKIFELEFYAALYTGNQNQVQNVLSQIQKQSKGWNMQMFEMWYGKFDNWLQGLQGKINNRDDFLKQVEANK